MAKMEQLELAAHREKLQSDVRHLVEKYRAIFEWDVPDIDQALSDRLIVTAMRETLDAIEKALSNPSGARPRRS